MNRTRLFDIIDTYPWDQVKGQLSFCEHIPQSLRLLIDNDADKRDFGYWGVDSNLIVTRYPYEGAFYVVPFLLAMLKMEESFQGDKLYELLYEIAYSTRGLVIISYDKVQEEFPYYLPVNGSESVILSIGCRREVLSGFLLFLEEVETNKHHSRSEAIHLLCSFFEHQGLVVSCLKEICEKKNDPDLTKLIESDIIKYFGDDAL